MYTFFLDKTYLRHFKVITDDLQEMSGIERLDWVIGQAFTHSRGLAA